MKNISNQFSNLFTPVKALLIYEQDNQENDNSSPSKDIYVESYDIGNNGKPINAHPLSSKEMLHLSEMFQSANDLKNGYLNAEGLIPSKVLHINHAAKSTVIWFTPKQERAVFFASLLDIPSGEAKVPPMIWKADDEQVAVYALRNNRKPSINTTLYHAPFFNVYQNGNVCMGTVNIQIAKNCFLGDFMEQWENYFWNSYFSHLMQDFNPVSTNIVQLWKSLVETGADFPTDVMKKTNLTIENILP